MKPNRGVYDYDEITFNHPCIKKSLLSVAFPQPDQKKREKNDAMHVNGNKTVKCVVCHRKPIARRIDTRFEYSSLRTVPARQNTTFYGRDGTCT